MHGRSNLNNIEMAYARQVKFATYMLIVHVLNNITLNSSKQPVCEVGQNKNLHAKV